MITYNKINKGGFIMAVEMRKRPVIKGADAMKFLQMVEQNKKRLEVRKAVAMKKWNDQERESKN